MYDLQNDDLEMLSKLNKILAPDNTMDRRRKNANRRIHIFLLEYGSHNKEYQTYQVTDYLENTIQYLEKEKLLAYSTDAIIYYAHKSG